MDLVIMVSIVWPMLAFPPILMLLLPLAPVFLCYGTNVLVIHRVILIPLLKSSSIKYSFLSFPFCTACTLSKNHHHPHPPTKSRSFIPFQLVHFDVRGPTLIESSSGNKFCVSLMIFFFFFLLLLALHFSHLLSIFHYFYKFSHVCRELVSLQTSGDSV